MSGGSYDYVFYKLSGAAETLEARHPEQPHVLALAALMHRMADVMRDIEWADSNDTSWTEKLDADIRGLLAPGAELEAALRDAERLLRDADKARERLSGLIIQAAAAHMQAVGRSHL